MSTLSTHVLDAVNGRPASGIHVELYAADAENRWQSIGSGVTDADGRIRPLGPNELSPGTYRIEFDTDPWFSAQALTAFYPQVAIDFRITDEQHYHVPLLLSPFAYSTYRGS